MSVLGKKLSHALRHAPEEYNLVLDTYGTAPVEDLLAAFGIQRATLDKEVISDDKTRFVFRPTETGHEGIAASQGHTIPVEIKQFPLTVDVGYHGTLLKNKDSILSNGLLRKKRSFVHVSKTIETAQGVGTRWRYGDVVIFKIDLAGLAKSGAHVFESENGVVLTDHVPGEFIEIFKIIQR